MSTEIIDLEANLDSPVIVEEVADGFNIDSRSSFAEDLRREQEKLSKRREQQSELEVAADDVPDKSLEKEKDPETDFFDQTASEDEKEKVVTEISGMTELAEQSLTDIGEGTQEELPADTREEPPEGILEQPPEDVLEESPADIPKEPMEDIRQESPDGTREETPEVIREEPPDGIREEPPEGTREESPEDTQKGTGADTGEAPPEKIDIESISDQSLEVPESKTESEAQLKRTSAGSQQEDGTRKRGRKGGIKGQRRRSSTLPEVSHRVTITDPFSTDLEGAKRLEKYTTRPPEETRRETIVYEKGPRYLGVKDDDYFTFDMPGELPFMLDEVQEEEEESIVEEEEKGPVLERAPYYKRHDQIVEELIEMKVRSFMMQKLLATFFRRKKMEYVTKEIEWSYDHLNKYNKKLEVYGELMKVDVRERTRLNGEINASKQLREEKLEELTTMFKKMQSRECEIGYGLIHTKTGNVIPDKLVTRLINRQNTQMVQVSSMRLTYIKLKQMVQEKLDSIADLDEIAPGFRLVDYEQLKIMNQSYADKIEEKDEILTRLRAKCSSSIQVLAHLREKSAALDNDLRDLKEEWTYTKMVHTNVRGQLNTIKQQRDVYRRNINIMRNESGLLTQPDLLRDMEQGLTDVKEISAHLEHLVEEHTHRSKQIKTIRRRIEDMKEQRRLISKERGTRVPPVAEKKPSSIYRGRPCLMIPEIDEHAFDSLRTIKPKCTYDRSRYRSGIKRSKRTGG